MSPSMRVVAVTFLILPLMPFILCQDTGPSEAAETTSASTTQPSVTMITSPVAVIEPLPTTLPPFTTVSPAGFPSQPQFPDPDSTLMGGTYTPTCHIVCEYVEPAATTGNQQITEAIRTVNRFRNQFGNRFNSPYGFYGNFHRRFPYSGGPFPYQGFPLFDEDTVDDPAEVDDMPVFVKTAVKQGSRRPQSTLATTKYTTLGTTEKFYKCKKVCS